MRLLPSRHFLLGLIVAVAPLVLAEPVGRALDICNPQFGCGPVLAWAGIPAGLAAGLLVRRWSDIASLVAGMYVGGVAYAVAVVALDPTGDPVRSLGTILFTVPVGSAVFVALFGLPVFAVVAILRWVARNAATGSGRAPRHVGVAGADGMDGADGLDERPPPVAGAGR
ncbi:MAG TPA: hypothetical protein VFX65_14540 [Candidatus Limnocylindrales bacterium]|nr:hypothetical protein [Candidatus Limnocylindrales bacterium]